LDIGLRGSFVKRYTMKTIIILVVTLTNTPAYCVAELLMALTLIVVVRVAVGAVKVAEVRPLK